MFLQLPSFYYNHDPVVLLFKGPNYKGKIALPCLLANEDFVSASLFLKEVNIKFSACGRGFPLHLIHHLNSGCCRGSWMHLPEPLYLPPPIIVGLSQRHPFSNARGITLQSTSQLPFLVYTI